MSAHKHEEHVMGSIDAREPKEQLFIQQLELLGQVGQRRGEGEIF